MVEEWEEPDYVSVKCSDPDGFVVEFAWEPDGGGLRAGSGPPSRAGSQGAARARK